ncbi:MAG: LysR substrate-binding domain-containing protein [Pseudomonadota bacterium]
MNLGQKRLPLKSLHAFEAVGRHLNMGQAASELSVTQSAISHQVRNLEKQLDTQLFDRSSRKLQLTPAGARLLTVVGAALDDIKRCTLDLDGAELSGKFTIASPPAFTNLWLMPRMPELLERFPDLELHFTYMPAAIPKDLPEADLVIQFGKHSWPRRRVVPLASADYRPYCSPRLLGGLGRVAPASLADQVLIHDDDGSAWSQWLSIAGHGDLEPRRHIYVNTSNDALDLARSGVGLTVNDQIVASHWVAEGELVAPFRPVLSSFERFFIVTAHEQQISTATREFETWLRQRLTETP